MSRKKQTQQQQLPVDTGGLDLTLPSSQPTPAEEPALDVLAAPSNAHKAVEELETLPPSQSLAGISGSKEPDFGECGTITSDAGLEWLNITGMKLMEAIHFTPLFMAARKTNTQALVLSNGSRFWTVNPETMEPTLYEGVAAIDGYREALVWRPVLGNERGWYVG